MIPTRTVVSLVIVMCLACAAFAHSGAMGVVKERMDTMKSIASAMKTIGMMIKGPVEFDPVAVEHSAKTIATKADLVIKQFPEGSLQMPTEASEEIWKRWEEFVLMNEAMGSSALELANLAANAESAEVVMDAFAALGKTCSQCHEAFRVKR